MAEWGILLGAIAAVLTAIAGLITALFVNARKARAEAEHTRAETQEVLARIDHKSSVTVEQVKNSHVDSNLRDDIDKVSRMLEQVHGLAARTDQQMTVVAAEHRALRQRVDRLDNDKHDTHKDLYDRLRVLEGRYLGWTGRRGRRRADETGEDDAV